MTTNTDRLDFYTHVLEPRLQNSATFLGNIDFPNDFKATARGPNQIFVDPTTNAEKTFLIFGEIATAERGTKLGAIGNHYQGPMKYDNTPIPLKDKSTAKDILKLCQPYDATDDITALFENQAVALNKVILTNKETDVATDTFPLATFECIDPGYKDSDLLYTVQLGKKFATPPSTYIPDTSQRLMKKRALASQQSKGLEAAKEDDKHPVENVKPKPQIGAYYNPELLHDYLPHEFDLKTDKLVQQNIVDTNGDLIPCWNNLVQLRPGTLVLCVVTFHTWNIPNEGRFKKKNEPVEGFKRFYTLNAQSVRVLQESPTPFSTGITLSPPHSSDAEDTPLVTAQDEFDSFTTKKRTETRTDNVLDAKSEATPEMTTDKPANIQPKVNTSKVDTETPVASSSKTTEKKERKKGQKTQRVDSAKPMSADFEMDTSV